MAEVNGLDVAPGGPVDVDQPDTLLNKVKDGRVASSLEPLRDRSPTLPPDPNETKNIEVAAYHDLIKGAGRPLFSLHLLDEVAENPGKYRDILRP